MMQKTRIETLNAASPKKGKYVVYWMQQSQRAYFNHALEYAIESANEMNLPVVVFFALTEFPEANKRHYWFMLQGLNDTRRTLKQRGIQMVVFHISPETGVVSFAKDASLVVVDMGYLRIQRRWREKAAQKLNCPLIQVESDVIVPVQ